MKSLSRILLLSIFVFYLIHCAQEPLEDISKQDTIATRKTVKEWSDAHEQWDFNKFKGLY